MMGEYVILCLTNNVILIFLRNRPDASSGESYQKGKPARRLA